MTETYKIRYKCPICGHEGCKEVSKDHGAHLHGYTWCPICGRRAEVTK